MTVEEIQTEIKSLSKGDYSKLKNWFIERDWQEWDQQIEEDSRSGKLDFLLEEAMEAKQSGNLRNL